jgi:hypothetical protein
VSNGQYHRDNDKPAKIWYFENSTIEEEQYWVNDQIHRANNKPASIWYFENGTVKEEQYWINGVKVK